MLKNNNKGLGLKIIFVVALLIIIAFFGTKNFPISFNKNNVNQEEIEVIISKVLKEKPTLIIEALQKYQEDQEKEFRSKAEKIINDKKNEIEDDKFKLAGGNPEGDISVVYFFDYNCIHCKKANDVLVDLINKDKEVKVLYKELPILGEPSTKIAKSALAVYLIDKNKYVEFHDAAMSLEILDDLAISNILKTLDIDQNQFNEVLKDPSIDEHLAKVAKLAETIGVRGTPAFLIGNELIPGSIDLYTFQAKIKQLRKAN